VLTGVFLEQGKGFDKGPLYVYLVEWDKKRRQKNSDKNQKNPPVFHQSIP
jgi:hypothetical protein